MTLYSELEKLADAPLAELTAKAGAGLRSGVPGAPYVLRREVDGTFSCVFAPYLDEDFHRQSSGVRDGARAFSIAALKKVFWDHMVFGHQVRFVMPGGTEQATGGVTGILPSANIKEAPTIRVDVGRVQWNVPPENVRTTLEEMIGIRV